MTTDPSGTTVALVGATGDLGVLLAGELLDRGANVRCLVRSASRGKPRIRDLERRGVETIEGDLTSGTGALDSLCRGAEVVISAAQGGPEIIIEAQMELLKAARDAKTVRRFVPSDFSYDIFRLEEGQNVHSDWRRAFAREAEELLGESPPFEVVHVLNGCFLDRRVTFGFLDIFDLDAGRLRYWGGGEQAMDFTTYADTARYTARMVLDPAPRPERYGTFRVIGEELTAKELAAAYNESTTTDRTVDLDRRGSIEELEAEIGRLRDEEPDAPGRWLPLQYQLGMFSGRGKIRDPENAAYPEIRPTTVREYVASEEL